MPTTFERTRIASAILTAVAMLSTPAFAADEAPDTTASARVPCTAGKSGKSFAEP